MEQERKSIADLENQVALVLGGGAGIGLATALLLARNGATAVVLDRDAQAAETAASMIDAAGGRAAFYAADVSSVAQLEQAFAFIAQRFGRLNTLFCTVGTTGPNSFDVSEAQFDEVFHANLKSHYFATNLAVPLMRACAPRASIIYMSSVAGLRAGAPSPLYSISKAAVPMMARCFARHLGPDKIRVNAVCPGHVVTDFSREWLNLPADRYEAAIVERSRSVPLGRVALPEDIAGTVLFLASEHAAHITGQTIVIDGGASA